MPEAAPRTQAPTTAEFPRTFPGASPALVRGLRWLFRLLGALSNRLAARVALALFVTPWPRPVRPAEAAFLATARPFQVRTATGTVSAYEWPAAGPRVLVVHGWLSHAGRMQDIIEALRARGLHVIAFDAPAHGRSSGRQLDIPRYIAAIEAVLAECGPVQRVLAHSFGSLSVLHWLAGSSAAAGGNTHARQVTRAVLVGLVDSVDYMMESFIVVTRLQPAVMSALNELFRRRYGDWPTNFPSAPLAARVSIPVLLAHGADDELIPLSHAHALQPAFPQAELLVFPGMKHSEPLRHAGSAAQLAAFLAAPEAAAPTAVAAPARQQL